MRRKGDGVIDQTRRIATEERARPTGTMMRRLREKSEEEIEARSRQTIRANLHQQVLKVVVKGTAIRLSPGLVLERVRRKPQAPLLSPSLAQCLQESLQAMQRLLFCQ